MGRSDDVAIVLLVGMDDAELTKMSHAIREDGHEVVEATSFEDARALLSSLRPDLLITRIQLGAFNGLHLVWQRQIEQGGQPSIVVSAYSDPVLESEARRLDCPFLVAPVEADVLLNAVHELLHLDPSAEERRQFSRTRIGPEVELEMDQGPATMVDVSYGGCRLRFHQGADMPLSQAISLPVPTAEVPIVGTPVWRASGLDGDVYGVAVAGPEEATVAWRTFVDGVTART